MSKDNPGSRHASFDDIMAQSDWVRRFALALVADPDGAADVTQEVLAKAWQRPPDDRGSLRPWLATVARNLVRSRARSTDRLSARHQALGQAAATAPAAESPEDLLARWELFKQVVAAVEALAEPCRQTVMLRYFDGLSSADIARREGIPEGTVRRRLKTGLDELRQRLDQQHEGRRERWVRLLLPLVPTTTPPLASAPGPDRAAGRWWLLPTAALVALVGFGFSWRWWLLAQPAHDAVTLARPVSGTGPGAAEARLGGAPAGFRAADPAGGGGQSAAHLPALATCLADVTTLRARRHQLERKMAQGSGPGAIFRIGSANPAAGRVMQPMLAKLMRDADGHAVAFELTCRDLACRIEFLWPPGKVPTFADALATAPELAGHAARWVTYPDEPIRDVLTGETMRRHLRFFGLRRQDAAALEAQDDWVPVRVDPPAPSDLATCRDEVQRLEKLLPLAQLELDADQNADHAYDSSPPNPALTDQMTPLLNQIVAQQLSATAVKVDCRGSACRFDVPPAWAKKHPNWTRQTFADPRLRGRVAMGRDFGPGQPLAYVRMIPPQFQPGGRWLGERLAALVADARIEDAVARCRPGPDTRGTVGTDLYVTTGRLPHESGDPAPIRFEQTGDLAGTRAGDCVTAVYQELVRDLEVPDNLWAGSVGYEHVWK